MYNLLRTRLSIFVAVDTNDSKMKIIFALLASCFFLLATAQQKTTLRVTTPPGTDAVYVTGNQEALGNWQPDKIKLQQISDTEWEIALALNFPAEFKFTRGSWQTEGYRVPFWEENKNIRITHPVAEQVHIKITSWNDRKDGEERFSFPVRIQQHYSTVFNAQRTIAVSLPKNYNTATNYPVVYVLDAPGLLKPFVLSLDLLSEKFIGSDGIDYGRDNIPEVITVGVFHTDRGYETKPKFNYTTDSTLLLEGAEKLRQYLFYELVPYINQQYATTAYQAIVGHSNTGHFVLNLPLYSDNPFKGIVSFSVNTESDYFVQKVSNFLRQAPEQIFIGYGTLDNGFNELGELLAADLQNKRFVNTNLSVQSFEASHNQLPVLAASTAAKHLFRFYKNHTNFMDASAASSFSVAGYFDAYVEANKLYGIDLNITTDDLFTVAEIAMKAKKIHLFREVIQYSSQQKQRILNHLIFWMATEINDQQTADSIVQLLLTAPSEEDIYLTHANLPQYDNYLCNVKRSPATLLRLAEHMFRSTKQFQLEFAYFFARTAYTHSLELKAARKYLDYCKKNFRENRIFTREDLNRLDQRK